RRGRVVGLQPDVGVPLADRGVGPELGGQLVADLRHLPADLPDRGPDVVTVAVYVQDLPLAVAEEGDGDVVGRGAAPLDVPEGEGVGGEGQVVAAVGLDPQADLLPVRPVELHVKGD